MQQFVSYLRVSSQRQGQSGLGLEAQREHVAQYVRRCGGEIIEEIVEVESGSLHDRPGLSQALAKCREEKAVLLIAKLDRLARSVAFVSSLMESSIEFVAVDMPFANKLLLHLMAAFAEHEKTEISHRTRAALAAAKARGVVLGKHGKILGRQRRDAAISWAMTMRDPIEKIKAAGAVTYRDFADQLNERGYRTRENCLWGPGTAQKLILRLTCGRDGPASASDQGGKVATE